MKTAQWRSSLKVLLYSQGRDSSFRPELRSRRASVLSATFSHLNRKTSRIFSLNRTPRCCVLVLKSARFKSSTTGFRDDLPNSDKSHPASNPRNELILEQKRILMTFGWPVARGNIYRSSPVIFGPPVSENSIARYRSCLSFPIGRTIDAFPESPAPDHNTSAPLRLRLRQRRRSCNHHPEARS